MKIGEARGTDLLSAPPTEDLDTQKGTNQQWATELMIVLPGFCWVR